MQQKITFKKTAPNHCGKLHVLNQDDCFPCSQFQAHNGHFSNAKAGNNWIWQSHKENQFCDCFPKLPISHFHKHCSFHTWGQVLNQRLPLHDNPLKILEIDLETLIFPGCGHEKGAVLTISHYFWGCTWNPSHSKYQKELGVGSQNVLEKIPKKSHI